MSITRGKYSEADVYIHTTFSWNHKSCALNPNGKPITSSYITPRWFGVSRRTGRSLIAAGCGGDLPRVTILALWDCRGVTTLKSSIFSTFIEKYYFLIPFWSLILVFLNFSNLVSNFSADPSDPSANQLMQAHHSVCRISGAVNRSTKSEIGAANVACGRYQQGMKVLKAVCTPVLQINLIVTHAAFDAFETHHPDPEVVGQVLPLLHTVCKVLP